MPVAAVLVLDLHAGGVLTTGGHERRRALAFCSLSRKARAPPLGARPAELAPRRNSPRDRSVFAPAPASYAAPAGPQVFCRSPVVAAGVYRLLRSVHRGRFAMAQHRQPNLGACHALASRGSGVRCSDAAVNTSPHRRAWQASPSWASAPPPSGCARPPALEAMRRGSQSAYNEGSLAPAMEQSCSRPGWSRWRGSNRRRSRPGW
jgi:hypothetical protein